MCKVGRICCCHGQLAFHYMSAQTGIVTAATLRQEHHATRNCGRVKVCRQPGYLYDEPDGAARKRRQPGGPAAQASVSGQAHTLRPEATAFPPAWLPWSRLALVCKSKPLALLAVSRFSFSPTHTSNDQSICSAPVPRGSSPAIFHQRLLQTICDSHTNGSLHWAIYSNNIDIATHFTRIWQLHQYSLPSNNAVMASSPPASLVAVRCSHPPPRRLALRLSRKRAFTTATPTS